MLAVSRTFRPGEEYDEELYDETRHKANRRAAAAVTGCNNETRPVRGRYYLRVHRKYTKRDNNRRGGINGNSER